MRKEQARRYADIARLEKLKAKGGNKRHIKKLEKQIRKLNLRAE